MKAIMFIFILLLLLITGCQTSPESDLDTEDGKYMYIEIEEDFPDYKNLRSGKTSCNSYCINNAGVGTVTNNGKLYCKCAIPTGI